MEAPDRIWIDPLIDLPKLNGHINNDSVEYTRTDAFIEKACKFLSNEANIPLWEGDNTFGCDTSKLVEIFKNYMKGE